MCGTASKYRPGSIKDILVKPLRIWKHVWAWIIIIYQPSIYLQRRGLDYLEPDVLWEYESKCGRGSIKDFLVNPLCVAPPSFSAPASIQADLWVLDHANRCPVQYMTQLWYCLESLSLKKAIIHLHIWRSPTEDCPWTCLWEKFLELRPACYV